MSYHSCKVWFRSIRRRQTAMFIFFKRSCSVASCIVSMAQCSEGEIIWSVDMTCMWGKAVALDDLDAPKTSVRQTRSNTMTSMASMASLHLHIHLCHFL